jgi:tripartite-type tricarboxylate transporter receptor subunit TctC
MKKLFLGLACASLVLAAGCGAQKSTSGTAGTGSTSAASSTPASGNASKTKFPEKEITLVVPFAPGGASDMTARTVAKEMEAKLKKPVIVVNKSGGTGGVGMSFVQASPKDGYTISYVPVELAMHKPLGLSDLEPSKFDPMAQATLIPAALTVQASAPFNTLEEFIDYAKKNPGKVKVGNSGTGSIWHVASSVFASKAGLQFTDIPFDGAAPAVTALMGGHVDAVTVSTGEIKSGIEAKKLKVLAVMSAERDKNYPNVPTLKEKGLDVEIVGWGGFVVPKGTPAEITKILSDAAKDAVNSEAFKKFADERGMTVAYKGPEDFAKFAESQFQFYNQFIPTLKLK